MRGLILAALLACPAAAAQPLPSSRIPEPVIVDGRLGKAYAPLIEELRRGGLVLLFRHDRTEPTGLWDYEPFEVGQCERQRRLSEACEASARAIGQAIRQLGIPVTRVIASTYCRAQESAAFMFAGVHRLVPDLIGADGKARTPEMVRREVDALILRERDPKGTLVLVGHHGTTDVYTTRLLDEGDALVIRPAASGLHQIVAHIPAARWEEIARDLDRERIEAARLRNRTP